jgi:hypothetical protein
MMESVDAPGAAFHGLLMTIVFHRPLLLLQLRRLNPRVSRTEQMTERCHLD